MGEIIAALLQAVLILGAAFGLAFFVKRDRFSSTLDYAVLRITLGLGCIALGTLAAAALNMIGLGFFILVLAGGNLLLLKEWRSLTGLWDEISFSWTWLLILPFLLVNLFYSFFPPTFYDTLLYHLAVPQYYLAHGGIVPWLTNFNSNIPLNVEMVFLFSLPGKTVYVPNFISFFSGLGILWLLYSWYRRYFSRRFFVLPVLLFYTIPEVGFLSSSAKSDMLGMLFLLAGVRLFCYYLEEQHRRAFLILSGLSWGLAIGSKYIFAFYLAAFMVLFLLVYRGLGFKKRVAAVMVMSLLVLLCLSPWLVKNGIITGNPLYPYMNSLFPSSSWGAAQAESFSSALQRGSSHSLWDYLRFPLEIFLVPYSYGMTAVLGLLFLVFSPFAFFSLREPVLKLLAGTAVLSFVLLLPFAMVPRYFLSSFLLLCLPMAAGAERVIARAGWLKSIVITALGVLLLANVILLADLQEKYTNGFAYVTARISGKLKGVNAKYLTMVPYYRAAEYINKNLGPADRVIFLGEERTFYVERDFIASSFNDRHLLLDILKEKQDFEEFLAALKGQGISHILFCPGGLERMGRMSPIYRLDPDLKAKLDDFLSRLPVIFQDKNYLLLATAF